MSPRVKSTQSVVSQAFVAAPGGAEVLAPVEPRPLITTGQAAPEHLSIVLGEEVDRFDVRLARGPYVFEAFDEGHRRANRRCYRVPHDRCGQYRLYCAHATGVYTLVTEGITLISGAL